MAFADRIAESGTTLFFYVRISGLPHVWFSCEPPSSWLSGTQTVTIDSELYLVHGTFAPGDELESVREEAQPWTGLAESSEMTLRFLLPGTAMALDESSDAWMDVLAASTRRNTSTAVLVGNLEPGDTTATLDKSAGLSGNVYVGTETLRSVVMSGADITSCVRGAYGSDDTFHVGSYDDVLETGAGGPYVASHPLTMAGRRVQVWIGTGYMSGSTLVPFGSTIESTEDRCIWMGTIRKHHLDRAQGAVTLACEGLRSELAREVGTRLPRGTVEQLNNVFFINDDNNTIAWTWRQDVDPVSYPARRNPQTQLQTSGGALADGWYSLAEINEALTYTITEVGTTPGSMSSTETSVYLTQEQEAGGITNTDSPWSLVVSSGDSSAGNDDYTLIVKGVNAGRSFWRSIGFEEEEEASEGNGSVPFSWRVTAPRNRPRAFIPNSRRTGWQIIVSEELTNLPFQASTGWTDDDGNAISGYVLIGEEVIEFTARAVASITGRADSPIALTLGQRGAFGTRVAELYEEAGEDSDPVEIVQGLCFPYTTWGRAGLYLATCLAGQADNGSFDKGWRGAGAAISADIINSVSWRNVAQATSGRRDIAVFESTPLDEVLARCLVPSQAIIVARSTDSGTLPYALEALQIRPPMVSDATDATSLGVGELLTIGGEGIDWSADESAVISTVVGANLGYDHGRGEGSQLTWINGTAKGTYPDSRAIDVDLRDLAGYDEATVRLGELAQILSANYGVPFLVIGLTVALPEDAWTLDVGDIVSITHPLILQRAAASRGVTALLGRVFSISRRYRGGGAAGHITVVAQEDGRRFGGYAPSALVNAVGGSALILTVDDNYDSLSGTKDVTRFAAGDKVRLYNPGNESAAESRTIDSTSVSGSADSSTITLTVATGLSVPIVVEPSAYNTSGMPDSQRVYVYLSDNDGQIDKASGADDAFEYL